MEKKKRKKKRGKTFEGKKNQKIFEWSGGLRKPQ